MIRLVQLQNGGERAVAVVEEPHLRLLKNASSLHDLAAEAVAHGLRLTDLIRLKGGDVRLDYDLIQEDGSGWHLLSPADHPQEPARCLVSGTGLTHLGSAKNRQSMHAAKEAELTDSMKMYRWGVEGGKPAPGQPGIAPEWFYKGPGTILRGPGEPLVVPAHAEDGGEEAEIAGVYYIGPDGQPWRIGMAAGNEFSDHKFERKNYLNLAGSKIRTCALGPELVVNPEFQRVPGTVSIERAGREIWTREIATGETEMCHSLANLEHHHFKFATHRRPGDLHVHFYGAHSLSFGDGLVLADGDVMVVSFAGFGRALRNPLRVEKPPAALVEVSVLK
jgi:hypothetical protein